MNRLIAPALIFTAPLPAESSLQNRRVNWRRRFVANHIGNVIAPELVRC